MESCAFSPRLKILICAISEVRKCFRQLLPNEPVPPVIRSVFPVNVSLIVDKVLSILECVSFLSSPSGSWWCLFSSFGDGRGERGYSFSPFLISLTFGIWSVNAVSRTYPQTGQSKSSKSRFPSQTDLSLYSHSDPHCGHITLLIIVYNRPCSLKNGGHSGTWTPDLPLHKNTMDSCSYEGGGFSIKLVPNYSSISITFEIPSLGIG